jgi:hypothetical protein
VVLSAKNLSWGISVQAAEVALQRSHSHAGKTLRPLRGEHLITTGHHSYTDICSFSSPDPFHKKMYGSLPLTHGPRRPETPAPHRPLAPPRHLLRGATSVTRCRPREYILYIYSDQPTSHLLWRPPLAPQQRSTLPISEATPGEMDERRVVDRFRPNRGHSRGATTGPGGSRSTHPLPLPETRT